MPFPHTRTGIFKPEKYPIEQVIDDAARIGFDGVEVLHRQMTDESPAYVSKLRRQAFLNGLDLVMLSIHQDFVSPSAEERRKHVLHTIRCIDLASALGIPCVRLNSGRWKTVKSFDDLMKVKGTSRPCPGTRTTMRFGGASTRSKPASRPRRRRE